MNRLLRMSYLVAAVAGVGFFVMSILLLGVWPGRTLEEQIHKMSPQHPLALTASESRGRKIYAREGCAYCHTQQIRYVASDVARFGRSHARLGDDLRLSAVVGHAPHWTRPLARSVGALGRLAVVASLCAARLGGGFDHAAVSLVV